MNSSQPTDQSDIYKGDPIVLDADALDQVAGGVIKTGDPVWSTVPDDQASAS
jgi:hypothetical protein